MPEPPEIPKSRGWGSRWPGAAVTPGGETPPCSGRGHGRPQLSTSLAPCLLEPPLHTQRAGRPQLGWSVGVWDSRAWEAGARLWLSAPSFLEAPSLPACPVPVHPLAGVSSWQSPPAQLCRQGTGPWQRTCSPGALGLWYEGRGARGQGKGAQELRGPECARGASGAGLEGVKAVPWGGVSPRMSLFCF